MAKLTYNECREIERKLHNPKWRTRLQRVQDIVQREFEKFRDQAETLLIRAIFPRTQIKDHPSVCKKIEENRRGVLGEQPHYSIDNIEDLIGIKVLCPYPSDAKKVIKQMRNHQGFQVRPRSNEEALREKEYGYRGYHFIIELKGPLILTNEDLMGIKCKVQVKTMLEEAWDAKTHDVTYRKEGQVSPELLEQMKLVSQDLAILDEKTEHLKNLIIQREELELKRKEAVVAVYLHESMKRVKEIISCVPNARELLKGKFTATNVLNLIPVIQRHREKHKLSTSLCRLAGLVGLYATGKHMDVWALNVCDELIRQEPENPSSYLTKGSVCWALNQLDDALEETQIGLKKAITQGNDELIAVGKGDFAYWVAEKAWTETGIEPELLSRAKNYVEDAIKIHPDYPDLLDTKGFLLITTALAKKDIKKGKDLISKARRLVISTPLEKIAKTFFERHETIALLKLSAFRC